MIIAHILTFLVFCYLLPVLLYLFVLAIAGRFGKLRRYIAHPDKARIAIIIPSYKEDAVIVETARQALTQQYPTDRYSITVVADQLQPATLVQLNALPINVIDVKLQKSMKARSLHAAAAQDEGEHADQHGRGHPVALVFAERGERIESHDYSSSSGVPPWLHAWFKKGSGTICAKHPKGRSGKWCLTPF